MIARLTTMLESASAIVSRMGCYDGRNVFRKMVAAQFPELELMAADLLPNDTSTFIYADQREWTLHRVLIARNGNGKLVLDPYLPRELLRPYDPLDYQLIACMNRGEAYLDNFSPFCD
ncbi:MAG: hypothetical protein ABIJ34_02545 [archaeon]